MGSALGGRDGFGILIFHDAFDGGKGLDVLQSFL